ncbi:MAG: YibE/F family protein [Cyanobacteria bacterium P01_H01_bin.74]
MIRDAFWLCKNHTMFLKQWLESRFFRYLLIALACVLLFSNFPLFFNGLFDQAPCYANPADTLDHKPADPLSTSNSNQSSYSKKQPQANDVDTEKTIAGDVYGVVVAVEALEQHVKTDQNAIQVATIRLDGLTGATTHSEKLIQAHHQTERLSGLTFNLKPGMRVLLKRSLNKKDKTAKFTVINYDRTPALLILGAVLILAILVIGGVELTKHALLVVLVFSGCYKALFPAILSQGTGPYWIFLMCAMFTILASFIYRRPGQSNPFSRQQWVVGLGTAGGLCILFLILTLLKDLMMLSGFWHTGLIALKQDYPNMDAWSLFIASVLFGFMGFLFYVSWSLAQTRQDKDDLTMGFAARFSLVMLRGKRLLGPLLSSVGLLTLSLLLPVLIQLQDQTRAQLINLEPTASMLAFIFMGLLTVILTMPWVAFLSALLMTPKGPHKPETQ